ncbi:MAG: DUF4097 family beta strand repeat-containing protein [Planctomycetota bacterium]|nr:DUF4097 family beta strand repeat-containing protein [Planctomycetota bacterium]
MNRLTFYLICVFIALSGCSTKQVMTFPKRTLETAGPIAVDVQSFAGDVTIIVDETIQDATIDVVQRIEGFEENEDPVKRIDWTSRIDQSSSGETLRLTLNCDSNPLQTVFADAVVRAPSIDNVTIRTKKGDVDVFGMTGTLDIKTSDGDVLVATPLPMNEHVTIETVRGDIRYRVREESAGRIDLTAVSGTAAFNMRFGEGIILPGSTGEKLKASFNHGQNNVVMRTVEGDITVDIVQNPIGDMPAFDFEWPLWQ